MGERPRKPKAFWQEHVEGFKGSGDTLRGYCAAHGLNRNTFGRWWRRIEVQSPDGTKPEFVALVARRPAKPGLSLRWPGGAELTVPSDCDPAWLAQVLSGLR